MRVKIIIITVIALLALVLYLTQTKSGLKQRFYFNVGLGKYENISPSDMNQEFKDFVDSHNINDLKILVKTGYSPNAG